MYNRHFFSFIAPITLFIVFCSWFIYYNVISSNILMDDIKFDKLDSSQSTLEESIYNQLAQDINSAEIHSSNGIIKNSNAYKIAKNDQLFSSLLKNIGFAAQESNAILYFDADLTSQANLMKGITDKGGIYYNSYQFSNYIFNVVLKNFKNISKLKIKIAQDGTIERAESYINGNFIVIKKEKSNFVTSQYKAKLFYEYKSYDINIRNNLYMDMIEKGVKLDIAKKISNSINNSAHGSYLKRGAKVKVIIRSENHYMADPKMSYLHKIYPVYFGILKENKYVDMYTINEGETFFDKNGFQIDRPAFIKKPVISNRIRFTSGFGYRYHPISRKYKGHNGVDYAAASGSPIVASSNGYIYKMSYDKFAGNFIKIKHGDGHETAYLHMQGFHPSLKIGDYVQRGKVIGYVGTTGVSTGPHLHFEVIKDGVNVNPMTVKDIQGGRLSGKTYNDLLRWKAAIKQLEIDLSDSSHVTCIGNERKLKMACL